MTKTFTREQIIRILNEDEAVGNTREACRKHNICEQTFYRWRNKFGGMMELLAVPKKTDQ